MGNTHKMQNTIQTITRTHTHTATNENNVYTFFCKLYKQKNVANNTESESNKRATN